MRPPIRKLWLTTHVASSVGWLGAVLAYLALAVAAMTTDDVLVVRAAYPSMALIGWLVIVPLCLAAQITGLVQALGTEWGLFRHYWVAVKLMLVVAATIVLLAHLPAVNRMADAAVNLVAPDEDLGMPHAQFVVHAVGGLLVLVAVTVISIFKPWGRTPHGRRVAAARRGDSETATRIGGAWRPSARRPPPHFDEQRIHFDGIGQAGVGVFQ